MQGYPPKKPKGRACISPIKLKAADLPDLPLFHMILLSFKL